MKAVVVFLLSITVATVLSQTPPASGTATAKGACDIASIGNDNTIRINCGVGEEQGKKMIGILNKILANQLDPTVVMTKLDEILATRTAAQQSQVNSGGINIEQGTTGANSPIVNSPITVGDMPKRIAAEDMTRVVQYLSAARSKTTIDIQADQYSGASQFPDDVYQAFKDAGWNMKEPGVNRYMGFSAPGPRFQGAVVVIHGEPMKQGEQIFVSATDPLFYVGNVLKAFQVERSLDRRQNQEDGLITINFEGGFPSGK
jgi:hypothetical protein